MPFFLKNASFLTYARRSIGFPYGLKLSTSKHGSLTPRAFPHPTATAAYFSTKAKAGKGDKSSSNGSKESEKKSAEEELEEAFKEYRSSEEMLEMAANWHNPAKVVDHGSRVINTKNVPVSRKLSFLCPKRQLS